MAVTYTDSYLKNYAPDREDDAALFVDTFGTFPEAYRDRLIEIRAYILTCIELKKSGDDLFTAKERSYKDEWETTLAAARLAAVKAATDSPPPPFMSIPIERA